MLRKEAQNGGLKTLAMDCLRKVKAGVTTLEEYNRVIFHEEEMASICPSCQEMIKTDFLVCPFCGHSIIESCTSCGRAKEPEWNCCPYCRHTFGKISEDSSGKHHVAVNQ
jgi:hypothetical protein